MQIQTIDSHTAGEPTRIVVAGGPDFGNAPLDHRRDRLSGEHDWLRSAAVNEPRGSDAFVGGLLCKPHDPTCDVGIIYFNNTGYLNMCVHGTIGLAVTLEHLGKRPKTGTWRIDTPVGVVEALTLGDGLVRVENVPSYRHQKDLQLEVPGFGEIRGDVAWGGNWFFLGRDHGETVAFENIPRLTNLAKAIRIVLTQENITGADGGEIDHVEIFGPADPKLADSRNFVLCPGGAYDRSPCGTGTSAKIACLFADKKIEPGQIWRQAGILGTVFQAEIRLDGEKVIPHITGSAFVNGESNIIIDPNDPFSHGITSDTVA